MTHGVGSRMLLHTAWRSQSSLDIRSYDNEYYISCIGRVDEASGLALYSSLV